MFSDKFGGTREQSTQVSGRNVWNQCRYKTVIHINNSDKRGTRRTSEQEKRTKNYLLEMGTVPPKPLSLYSGPKLCTTSNFVKMSMK